MDLIGLLIFLYIAFRSASDKKRGKEKTSPQRKTDRKFGHPSPEDLEEIFGKFFGAEEVEQYERLPIDEEETYESIEREEIWETREDLKRKNEQVEPIVVKQLGSPLSSAAGDAVREKASVKKTDVVVKPMFSKTKETVLKTKEIVLTGVDLRQAFIWSEILQKPKALRRRNML